MQNHGFKRSDTNMGAIINVDHSALASYKKQRELMRTFNNQDARLKNIENSIEELKDIILKLTGNN